jgi:hypothetical protein
MAKQSKAPGKQLPKKTPEQEEKQEYAFWIEEIKRAKKANDKWFDQAKKIEKLYKDERAATADGVPVQDRMNILWSNVQVLQPSIYSRDPTPNVSRRYLNRDPVSRTAALIVERNLHTAIDLFDFGYPMRRVRDDYLLVGRGIPWVRFAPEFGMKPMREYVTKEIGGLGGGSGYRSPDGQLIEATKVKEDDDGECYFETEPVEQVLSYGLGIDHVRYCDFLHEPVNDWTKVGWVASRHLMKRPELSREFGDKGKQVELKKNFEGDREEGEKGKANAAEVWQIWAKGTRKVIWLTDGLPEKLLRKQDDPLKLSKFWPCPRPILATTTTDSLIPVPDYVLYQDQASQIDKITDRIRILTQALRVVGVYNASVEALAQLLEEASENQMVPVENWMNFGQTGGLKGNLDWFPIEQIAQVLTTLFSTRAQLRNDLYEVTGISDIIRGVSAPEETATAQQIKSNFGSLRLQDKQNEMSRVARDTLRIMAEIQCEHYSDEALVEMSGILESDEFDIKPDDPQGEQKRQAAQQRVTDAIKLIRDDKLRSFKIDIETDATVAPDQEKEKQARVEFLTAVAPFLEKAAQVGMSAPQLVPLLLELLNWGVRGFRTGRTMEAAIEETVDTAKKMLEQSQQQQQGGQPQPDPAAEAAAQELKAKAETAMLELEQAKAEAANKAAENQARAQEMQANALKAQQKADLEIANLQAELAFRKEENTKRLAELDASIRLKELQIAQIQQRDEHQAAVAEIQGMIPPEAPQQPEPTEAEKTLAEAKLVDAQASLLEAQIRKAEVEQRVNGLNTLQQALGGQQTPPAEPGAQPV